MRLNILFYALIIFFSFHIDEIYDPSFTFDNPEVNSTSITVLQPCSSNTNSIDDLEKDSLFDDCRGEYRYCGNDVFRCLRVDGLFACCDHPETCPGGDDED